MLCRKLCIFSRFSALETLRKETFFLFLRTCIYEIGMIFVGNLSDMEVFFTTSSEKETVKLSKPSIHVIHQRTVWSHTLNFIQDENGNAP